LASLDFGLDSNELSSYNGNMVYEWMTQETAQRTPIVSPMAHDIHLMSALMHYYSYSKHLYSVRT